MNLAVGPISELTSIWTLLLAASRKLRSDPAVDCIPQLFVADRTPRLRMNLAFGSDLRAHLHVDVAVGRISQTPIGPCRSLHPATFRCGPHSTTPHESCNWLLSAASRNSDRTLPLTASRNFSLLIALHDSA